VRFLSTPWRGEATWRRLNQELLGGAERSEDCSTATRTSACLRHPVIPFARNSFANASSVSRFPRERIRDITSERFALEKTSGMVAILSLGC
jgi:hypothetical protein